MECIKRVMDTLGHKVFAPHHTAGTKRRRQIEEYVRPFP